MDKLLAVSAGVGQPLRPEDWEFIQNATVETIKNLVNGLAGVPGNYIITGLNITYDSTHIYVAEGIFFDGQEFCYVPAANYTIQGGLDDNPLTEGYKLYLTPDNTTGELRTFKDTTTHNVRGYNRYATGYAAAVPSGSIEMTSLENILDVITAHVIEAIPPAPASVDLMYLRKVFSADSLEQWQIVIPRPGIGKVTQVISMSARVDPAVQLEVGGQSLNVFYGDDVTEIGIGSFPNNFLEEPVATIYDMVPNPGQMYENEYVSIGLSGETGRTAGSANIIIYCLYKIITL